MAVCANQKQARCIGLLCLAISLFYHGAVPAGSDSPDLDDPELGSGEFELDAPRPPRADGETPAKPAATADEGEVLLPAVPSAGKLAVVSVPGTSLKHLVDTASLNYDAGTGIVRYTVIIESPAGARNVFYEGIHCASAQYKLYAYANQSSVQVAVQDAVWRRIKRSEWRKIGPSGGAPHRRELMKSYFCEDDKTPVPVADILERLQTDAE